MASGSHVTTDWLGCGRIRSTCGSAAATVAWSGMEMLPNAAIARAALIDWRKLAQGLHARYLTSSFSDGARFMAAIAAAGDEAGHHPRVVVGAGHVDLELVSADAVYRDDEGTEHVIEWVTQQDVDLARRIEQIAAGQRLTADPGAVCEVELGLDTTQSAAIAPVWAALLTGNADDQGRGTFGDEIRDATVRVPNLWFGDPDESNPSAQRVHVEVYVAPEARDERLAAALAAGGTIVDDSDAPRLTVIADQDGNKGVLCVTLPAALPEG